VPIPELGDVAVQLVQHELSGPAPGAQIEDRIIVDLLMHRGRL
jgi:hypothetical protein